jgi:hypothetical protein
MGMVWRNVLIAVLRALLFRWSADAVEAGLATSEQVEMFYAGLAGFIIFGATLFRAKYYERFKLLIAMNQPKVITEKTVEKIAKRPGERIGTYVGGGSAYVD